MTAVIKKEDRKFLIQGLPVYFVLLVLIAGMVILYQKKLSKHGNEPLPVLISKNLRGIEPEYRSLDDVINARKSWEPALPDWQGRQVPDFTLILPGGQTRHLADFQGQECVILIGATWFPPFRLQIAQFLQWFEQAESENPFVLALIAESAEKLEAFSKETALAEKGIQLGRIEDLPEPFSLPDGFPSLFFVDPQGRLKLAATGLVPAPQLKALCRLPLKQD